MVTPYLSVTEAMNMFQRKKGILTARAGLIALSAVSSIALAHTYQRCDADGDHCVTVTCDNDGDRCWRESEYSRNTIYTGAGRWTCDADGDRCRFEYDRKGKHHREHHDEDHQSDK